ncbi:1-phosphofructokinase [Leifsonia bigeumensis]|uniref:1-phosphofructokinase n=1 Tax=Leifsonella bigeumensis TaxID=433643 RepID=A0ABP7F8E1_9MICO
MITVVALSPSVDVTYVVDEFVLGEVHRPRSVHREAGGKSLNAARAAAALGARVSAVAALSGATGEFVAQRLADAGVELSRVGGGLETRTCVSIASATEARMTELYERATPLSDAEWQSILNVTRDLLPQRPGWLAVAGSVPSGLDDGVLARLVELGVDAGLSVAIDSHGPALGPAVDAGAALVKVNRAEAASLLGRDDESDILEFAEAIHERSRGIVVVTDGVAGSAATNGQARWRVSPSEAVGAFSVGSGDSFLGGMLSALDDGADLAGALRLGAGCATANALEPGAARFDPERARSIAAELTVEQVR